MRKFAAKAWYIILLIALFSAPFVVQAESTQNKKSRSPSSIYSLMSEKNPYDPYLLSNPLGKYEFGYTPGAIDSPYALYEFKYSAPKSVPNPFLPGGSSF